MAAELLQYSFISVLVFLSLLEYFPFNYIDRKNLRDEKEPVEIPVNKIQAIIFETFFIRGYFIYFRALLIIYRHD